MIPFLFSIYIFSVGLQLFFILFVFAKVNRHESPIHEEITSEGVSVIVCAWNELENLKELIPLLDEQDYPNFEVIIMDDRSWDGTHEYLMKECSAFQRVRFIQIEKTPAHLSAKKYALTLGIKSAKYDVILLTDADCRPQSKEWIKGMAECLLPEKKIVLGFSPYYTERSFLNKLIRYETFITALQYFSLAIKGQPYMGVGRNLMYRKSLFLENKGFAKHTNIVGGDDDLFMNDVATKENTTVCLNSDTFMYSVPKSTWEAWYRQKTRHLSVSKYYRFENKLILGSLASTQIFSWILLFALIPYTFHTFQTVLLYAVLCVFALRLIAQWIVFAKANQRFDNIFKSATLPLWDFIFTLYFLIMGVNNLIPRKKKMRWK